MTEEAIPPQPSPKPKKRSALRVKKAETKKPRASASPESSTPPEEMKPTTDAPNPEMPKDVRAALKEMAAPVGRPSKITKELAEKLFTLIAAGIPEEKIAQILDISQDTIYRTKRDVEFSGVLARAKDEADLAVINSLYQRAIGYTHPEEKIFCHEGVVTRVETLKHYPPDTAAGMFWLQNRRKEDWRREIQHEENKPKPAVIRLFSPIHSADISVISRGESQVDVLFGGDFTGAVQKKAKQPEARK